MARGWTVVLRNPKEARWVLEATRHTRNSALWKVAILRSADQIVLLTHYGNGLGGNEVERGYCYWRKDDEGALIAGRL